MKEEKNTKRTIYYKMDCGCLLFKEDLVHGPQSINYRFMCPIHGSFIKYKYGFCFKCGKKIKNINTKAKVAMHCIKCNPALGRKKRYAEKKKKAKNKVSANAVKIAVNRSDCIFRPLCVEVHLKEIVLPCYKCNEYNPQPAVTILPYSINLDELDSFIKSMNDLQKAHEKTAARAEGFNTWGKIFEKREQDIMRNK